MRTTLLTVAVAASALAAQAQLTFSVSATAPSSSVVASNPGSDSNARPSGINGPNVRFRSGGADTDVGNTFVASGTGTLPLQAITVRVAEFTLGANPTLQIELFTVAGATTPDILNSDTTRTPFTDPVFTHVANASGTVDVAGLGLDSNLGQYLTFDLSSLGWTVTGGQRYGFLIGFVGQTVGAGDVVRLGAQGTGSYADGFEIRRDYEFGATRSASDLLAVESASASRDLTFFVQVPEPSTYAALAGIAALAAAALRRRRS